MPPAEKPQPIMRRASTAGTLVRTPTPLRDELHPLNGSYKRNISRLEKSAAQMSFSGSDLGDEIRRIASAGSRRSRQSSIQSSHHGDISVVRPGMAEKYGSGGSGGDAGMLRRSSTSGSRSRYRQPGANGYVGSPLGSVHASVHSHASIRSSRLAQVNEPMQEGRPLDSPMRSGFPQHLQDGEDDRDMRQVSDTSFGRRYDEIAGNIRESLVDMVPSSSAQQNEGMRRESHHLEIEGTATPPDRPRSTDTYQEAQLAFIDFDGVHFSPDTDELVEIDEYGNEVRRISARNSSGALSHEAASLLRTPRARPISYAEPPPGEDMVYYPAPVPRMLNLPKRLSQLPAASVQAKRRSQMLAELPPEARAAAPWLPPADPESRRNRSSGMHSRGGSSGSYGSQRPSGLLNERMSTNPGNLPHQLRAGAFFDHPSVQHDVEVKGESAVATLDSILAASATAPVRAFTDHPYAGDVHRDVYSAERKKVRNSSSTVMTASPQQKSDKKKRSSSIGAFFKRSQSSDALDKKLEKRSSRGSLMTDLGGEDGKVKKRRSILSLGGKSTLSLGGELDREQTEGQRERDGARTPDVDLDASSGLIAGAQNNTLPDTPGERRKSVMFEDNDQIQKDFEDEEVAPDVDAEEEEEPMFVQPSTLLAELQVRKAQLKSRNRTAATAFPTGMHSTLLQLDAVEEISKRKRQKQRIALAWEDPHQRALEEEGAEADEDVPLGKLYPGKERGMAARKVGDGKDWDRPLGLMEKRLMEDNEPLSSRRNRLQGNDTGKGRPPSPHRRPGTGLGLHTPQLQQDAQPDVFEKAKEGDEDSEHEGETLGQRMRRMRTKDTLDGTIAHIEAKEGHDGVEKRKSGWSEEWASQFGNLDVKDTAAGADKTPPALSQGEIDPEDETLGQRRARLQREAAAGGEGGSRNTSGGSGTPALRSSSSLANLLASNPTGQRKAASRAHTAAAGTLLHASAEAQAKSRSQLRDTNMRSSSYALGAPLVDAKPRPRKEERGMLGMEGMQSRAATGGFGGGMYSNGAGGANVAAISAYQNQGMGMGMGGVTGGVAMVGTPGGNGMFASPTAGYFGGAAGYGQPQMQMQMQPQMQMGMGGYGYPYQQQQQMGYPYPQHQQMGYPGYNMGMMQQQYPGHMQQPQQPQQSAFHAHQMSRGMGGGKSGTYASFAQTGHLPGEEGSMGENGAAGGMGGVGGGFEGGAQQPKSAIERWRMGIQG